MVMHSSPKVLLPLFHMQEPTKHMAGNKTMLKGQKIEKIGLETRKLMMVTGG